MSPAEQVVSKIFESSAIERLESFIAKEGSNGRQIVPLTPDASTRKYFRIGWKKGTAVAAVYAEPFDPHFHPYLDVNRLFLECDLPVPEVLAVDGPLGVIVQEDLGERQLFQVYEDETEDRCDEYKEQAISLIAKIQKGTERAYSSNSIASRLAFDEAKLSWELNFFVENFFGNLRREKLRHAEKAELESELNDISAELAAVPRVLCHRDYHAANLMVDSKDQLRIIDHQDARMGPASYDLVSFLLDRQPCTPSLAELRSYRLFFLDQRRLNGLPAIDPDDFASEFRLMTIQRGLKATGTFSYQTAVSGRGLVYEQFIQPTLEIVLQAADWLEKFPTLRRMLRERISK